MSTVLRTPQSGQNIGHIILYPEVTNLADTIEGYSASDHLQMIGLLNVTAATINVTLTFSKFQNVSTTIPLLPGVWYPVSFQKIVIPGATSRDVVITAVTAQG